MRVRKMRETDIGDITGIVLRIMGPRDARRVLADIKETLQKKETLGERQSAYKFDEFYVAEIDRRVVAAGGVWALRHDPYIGRLDWFMVHPEQQRKGLGSILLKTIEKEMRKKKIRLILAETSSEPAYKTAVKFWAKNGFKEILKIPGYWEDGSACLYFMKRLK